MNVEDAEDLAGFFDTDEFGESATYTPQGGMPVEVTVIVLRPRETAPLGQVGARGPKRLALLRKSEVSNPKRDDQLTVAGETLTLRAKPTLDDTGAVWRLDLSE